VDWSDSEYRNVADCRQQGNEPLWFGGVGCYYLSSWGVTCLSKWIPLREVRYRLGPTGCSTLGAVDSGPPV